METTATFAARLRDLRERRKLTQGELADRIASTQQTVSAWETGTEPGVSGIRSLAEFFECTSDYLLCLTDGEKAITPGHFLVDLDAYEAFRDGRPRDVPKGQTWWAAIAERPSVVSPTKYAAMTNLLPAKYRHHG